MMHPIRVGENGESPEGVAGSKEQEATAMRKILRVLGKMALGAAVGAVALVLMGQVVGLFAESCTVACAPGFSARFGALAGMFAIFAIRPYQPG